MIGHRWRRLILILGGIWIVLACQVVRGLPLEPANPTVTPAATAPPATPDAAPMYDDPRPVIIVDQGFSQDENQVSYGFVVENPNPEIAMEGTGYEVIAYDEAGIVLGSTDGVIRQVGPGAQWGVGGRLSLQVKVPVAELVIDLRLGDGVAPFPEPAFDVDRPTIIADPAVPRATAILHNPYVQGVADLPVSVVAFDAQGAVVGGGYTYVDFVPGEGQIGVQVSLLGVNEMARVDFYASPSGLTERLDVTRWPEGVEMPAVRNQGFAQDQRQLAWGIEVENTNKAYGVEGFKVHVDVLDARGAVLAAQDSRIHLLLPEQNLVYADQVWLPEGRRASQVVINVLPEAYVAADRVNQLPRFSGEDAVYEFTTYSDSVTGRIANPSDLTVTNVRVSALLYDADGAIVGAGFTYLDLVPARGRAAANVRVVTPFSEIEPDMDDLMPVLGAVLTSLTESR